jgi:hypothetical protein
MRSLTSASYTLRIALAACASTPLPDCLAVRMSLCQTWYGIFWRVNLKTGCVKRLRTALSSASDTTGSVS